MQGWTPGVVPSPSATQQFSRRARRFCPSTTRLSRCYDVLPIELANSPLADVRVFPGNQEKSIRFQYKEIQMSSRTWILTAALALGSTGLMAPSSLAKEREYDEQIKYSELPKDVQKTVDKERGKHEVK